MANQYLLKTDVTFHTKYQILDDHQRILANVPNSPLKDAYDGILGWLISLPTTFTLLLSKESKITVQHGWGLFSMPYRIALNDQLIATVTRGPALQQSPITVTSHGHPSHLVKYNLDGSFWGLEDQATGIKLVRCELQAGTAHNYKISIWERLNQPLMLGIVLAIINIQRK